MSFFESVAKANVSARHQIAIGIDPNIDELAAHSPLVKNGIGECLFHYGVSMYEAANGIANVFKIQSAFFEAHGAEGYEALRRLIAFLKSKEAWVILDVKRGDIASTMKAYAHSAFDFFHADAITVLPYMGISTVDVLAPWLRQGKGVYLVWLSSNPDGFEWQTLSHRRILHDVLVWQRKFELNVGFVLGATKVEDLEDQLWLDVRSTPMLLPGFGAQGAVQHSRHVELQTLSPASLFPISRGLFDPRFQVVERFEDIAHLARQQLLLQIAAFAWGG